MKYLRGLAWALVAIFIGAMAATVESAEYWSYPLSGHPNYIEPSTFPKFEVNIKDSFYLTDIHQFATVKVCATLKDNSVVELDSNGGDMVTSFLIMECIKDRNITIAITNAYSAAATILMSGAKVCIHPKANIGYHSPYKTISKISKYELDLLAKLTRVQLKGLGYSTQKITYLERFTRLSTSISELALIPHGTLAGILGDRFVGSCEYTYY